MAAVREALALTALAAILSAASGNYCCPEGSGFVKYTKNCVYLDGGGESDGGIQEIINCTHGMYLVDPVKHPHDQFFVLPDGHLQVGSNDSFFLAPPHTYCIARVQKDKNNTPSSHNMAFICFPGEEQPMEDSNVWRYFFSILQAISTVFLFLTLVVYVVVPELRDLQGRCIMSTVFCQMIGYLFLFVIQFKSHIFDSSTCILSAFFLYFWMLASFFWLSVNSFNVWRAARYRGFPLNDRQLFWCYCAFGWLCPLTFLVATLATHHTPGVDDGLLRPNFGFTKCWFDGNTETWVYFYSPISILLACNVVFFLMTAKLLWMRGECDNSVPGIKASRFKCLLYLKVFIVMGILWIFEVLSFAFSGIEDHWRIPDLLNSLQGVFIFLVVVCRKRVFRGLAKREWGRTVVMATCPKWCTSGPDEEQEAPMLTSPGDDETYVPMESADREHT